MQAATRDVTDQIGSLELDSSQTAIDDSRLETAAGDLLAGPSMRQCTHVRSPDGVCL